MNLTIKEATVTRYHYARHLKTLQGLTPCEYICKKLDIRARSLH